MLTMLILGVQRSVVASSRINDVSCVLLDQSMAVDGGVDDSGGEVKIEETSSAPNCSTP